MLPSCMARFAKRVLSIESSPTVRISELVTEMKARGEKVVSLAIGEPDFPTPAHIVEAAKKALDDGYTKYTPAPGIKELREAIAEKSLKENEIPAKPENVIVAPTKHTLFLTCMALLDRGDEALIPDPGWVSYGPMVTLAGAKPVPDHAAHAPPDAQLALEPWRLGVLARRDAGPRRHGGGPRPDRCERRDLREDPLRRRARLARVPGRHVRPDRHGARILEDVRDDGMAARMARRTDAAIQRDREGPGAHDHLRDRVRAEGRRRRPPRADRPARGDGGGVPLPKGPRHEGGREDRPTLDGSAERRVLRLPEGRCTPRQRDPVRANPERGLRRRDAGQRVRRGGRGPHPPLVRGVARDDYRGRAADRRGPRETRMNLFWSIE